MTATELARNLSRVLDRLEHESEEITVIRNKHTIAHIVPGTPVMTAMEAFSDLVGAISEDDGEAWIRDCESIHNSMKDELRDPWA